MPSIAAPIVIADGQTTPVNVSFSPERISPAQSYLVDRTSGVSNGFRRLGFVSTFVGGINTVNKSKMTVELPITATVDGVTTVVRTLRAKVEYILPDGCTDAERKDLHAFVVNGLNNTTIRPMMRDLDPMY